MKPSKYRNIKTVIDGIEFDSKREAAYYGVLKMRKLAGEITKIETQVKFSIDIEVIDVKGVKTTVYQLKKKLMKAVWGIDIIEK